MKSRLYGKRRNRGSSCRVLADADLLPPSRSATGRIVKLDGMSLRVGYLFFKVAANGTVLVIHTAKRLFTSFTSFVTELYAKSRGFAERRSLSLSNSQIVSYDFPSDARNKLLGEECIAKVTAAKIRAYFYRRYDVQLIRIYVEITRKPTIVLPLIKKYRGS